MTLILAAKALILHVFAVFYNNRLFGRLSGEVE